LKLESIPLDQIDPGYLHPKCRNVRDLEDLLQNIKAVGLVNPIVVINDEDKVLKGRLFNGFCNRIYGYGEYEDRKYRIIVGSRRYEAYLYLNEQYPKRGFDKINCIIHNNITTEQMTSMYLSSRIFTNVVSEKEKNAMMNNLYNEFNDLDLTSRIYGIPKNMIRKYVKSARLSEKMKSVVEGDDKVDQS
tara:strand:+ start:88 stop:654 length:567 start_codon:yes stop_codon:yes gene_type:complete